MRSNPTLRFVRCAGNEIGPAGGAALAEALGESVSASLLLDATHNYAISYAHAKEIALSNNRRRADAGPSPLDGMTAKDAMD